MEIPGSQRRVLNLMDEVIIEILSWLPVKYLLQLRCVCKSWKSLISHPCFVNLHLQRSPKNANLVLSITHIRDPNNFGVMSCSKRSFMENPSSTIASQEGRFRSNNKYRIVGSCNGLVCLLGDSRSDKYLSEKYWVRFWNPATRLKSKKSPRLPVDLSINQFGCTKFGFGYDKSTDTYKVVAVLNNRNAIDDSKRTQVKVYTMGNHCWRDIERFPAFPIIFRNEGRFLSGTLNWLAIRNFTSYDWDTIAIDQLVIVSLDLGKETYQQILLPDGFDINPNVRPTIGVLGDCLCLFHDYKETHFVVWQMNEFGVQESWTRFVNVGYEHLQVERSWWPWPRSFLVLPVCISENGDVLMLIDLDYKRCKKILYHRIDNRVEHTDIPKNSVRIDAKDYLQSLVRPC